MSNENPDLLKVVTTENPLKQMLVNYVGEKLEPENDEVNIEMIIQVMAEEFPDMLLTIAEENFIRGYQQALADVDAADKTAAT
jgi:predicted double-glycine peptidase